MKGYPFEVTLPDNLPISGVILSDQVKSLDWRARNAEFICTLGKHIYQEAIQKMLLLIK